VEAASRSVSRVRRLVNLESLGRKTGRNNILGKTGNEVLGMKGNIGQTGQDALNELSIAGADISRCC
jgi:hypothetical protein